MILTGERRVGVRSSVVAVWQAGSLAGETGKDRVKGSSGVVLNRRKRRDRVTVIRMMREEVRISVEVGRLNGCGITVERLSEREEELIHCVDFFWIKVAFLTTIVGSVRRGGIVGGATRSESGRTSHLG